MTSPSRNMVWLVSYPKSGNTWIRILLSNYLSDEDKPISINEINSSIISSSRSIFDYHAPTLASDLSHDEVDLIRPEVYRALSKENEQLQFVKTHDAYTFNGDGKPIFPKGITKAVVYIVRNPLDVAISFAHHSGISIDESIQNLNKDVFCLAKSRKGLNNQLRQQLLSWSQHYLTWKNADYPFFLIRYEDLKADTLYWFRELILYLYDEVDELRLQKAVEFSDFKLLQQQEKNESFREKPMNAKSFFRSGKSNVWKETLTARQIDALRECHQEVMQELGYW